MLDTTRKMKSLWQAVHSIARWMMKQQGKVYYERLRLMVYYKLINYGMSEDVADYYVSDEEAIDKFLHLIVE